MRERARLAEIKLKDMQNQHALEEEKKKRIAMPDWERLEATE